jgi:hypothetical protein
MELSNNVTSQIVDAMENDISPKTLHPNANPLNKVYHADITINSYDDVPASDAGAASPRTPLIKLDSETPEDGANAERASDMQVWWDEAIAKNMDLPDGYNKVAVLLVKWEDELDELKTKKEVSLHFQ